MSVRFWNSHSENQGEAIVCSLLRDTGAMDRMAGGDQYSPGDANPDCVQRHELAAW